PASRHSVGVLAADTSLQRSPDRPTTTTCCALGGVVGLAVLLSGLAPAWAEGARARTANRQASSADQIAAGLMLTGSPYPDIYSERAASTWTCPLPPATTSPRSAAGSPCARNSSSRAAAAAGGAASSRPPGGLASCRGPGRSGAA